MVLNMFKVNNKSVRATSMTIPLLRNIHLKAYTLFYVRNSLVRSMEIRFQKSNIVMLRLEIVERLKMLHTVSMKF